MGKKYFIFPANYEIYDFQKLFDECTNNNGHILWQKGKKPLKNIEVDDVCYLYYSNLPDGTSRIIMRGEIASIEEKDYENGEEIKCYAISNLKTINWKNSGKTKFTREVLREYGVKMNLNKRQLMDNRNNEDGKKGDEDLRIALEKYYESPENKKMGLVDLQFALTKDIRCAMDDSCNNTPNKAGKHYTFIAKNGLPYYEHHHFIPRNQGNDKNYPELKDDIEEPNNIITLCSNCHNEMHYGKREKVERMIEKIYTSNKSATAFFDDAFKKILNKKHSSALEWLKSLYLKEK